MNLDPIDITRLRQETSVAGVEYFDEIESTNTYAVEIGARLDVLPHLVLAERQTAGRGRGEHRWWSGPGALTYSLIVERPPLPGRGDGLPLDSLAVGLAVAEAVQSVLEDRQRRQVEQAGQIPAVMLKWPNDIYVLDRKLGGILIEGVTRSPRRLVIGIGLNVNNSLATAPAEVRERGLSLIDIAGGELSRTDLLIAFLRAWSRWKSLLVAAPYEMLAEYRRRCWLSGRRIKIHSPQESVTGLCHGVTESGALRIETASGCRDIVAGVIEVAF